MDKNEARDRVRKMMIEAGQPEDEAAKAAEGAPDEVLQAIMDGHELQAVRVGLETLLDILTGGKRHLPGCDGNHGTGWPEIGIELSDAADADDKVGAHGMGNLAVIIKTALSYVALEQVDGYRRYLREREEKHGLSVMTGRKLSDYVSESFMAWLALSIRHPHRDCPAMNGGECPDGATLDGQEFHADRQGVVPEAFRKPRFTAGRNGTEDAGEPIIDPHAFGYHRPLK